MEQVRKTAKVMFSVYFELDNVEIHRDLWFSCEIRQKWFKTGFLKIIFKLDNIKYAFKNVFFPLFDVKLDAHICDRNER